MAAISKIARKSRVHSVQKNEGTKVLQIGGSMTVSKLLRGSSQIKPPEHPLDLTRSLVTLTAVLVEWWGRKPDCRG